MTSVFTEAALEPLHHPAVGSIPTAVLHHPRQVLLHPQVLQRAGVARPGLAPGGNDLPRQSVAYIRFRP